MMTENAEREKRREKARRLKQSFELLRLCKETLENEGATWEKSKERRELEKQRLCRVQEGQTKKEALIQKREKEQLQRKITDSLATLPKNRQILLLREEERERLILLQEAKKEIWKRWRQRKGRGMKMNEIKQKDSAEDMERKLGKIEAEVERYHQELQAKELELKAKKDRKKRKEQKEKQWEMMRWLVSYIETNKEAWQKRRQEEIREREQQEAAEEWRLLTKEQRIEKLKGEEAEVRKT